MSVIFGYCSRTVPTDDLGPRRTLFKAPPEANRRAFSPHRYALGEGRQPTGALRDRVWRSPRLVRHRAGYIRLPAAPAPPNDAIARRRSLPGGVGSSCRANFFRRSGVLA